MSKPALYRRDPQATSVAAALTVNTASQEERVAAYLQNQGLQGATDQEMQRDLGIQRARTRRQALVERGLVVDSGQRRKTESGKDAIVWRWHAVRIASVGRIVTRTPRSVPKPVATAEDLKAKPSRRRGAQSKKDVTPRQRRPQLSPEERQAKADEQFWRENG